MHRPPASPRSILIAALVGVAACATSPDPGQPESAYVVAGSYAGRFVFDGQSFSATLQLRTARDGRVSGAFRVGAPLEVEGPAEGVLRDEFLRLTVEYPTPDGCDGRIEGILTVEPGGDMIDGPVTVLDCGAPVAGRMTFRRVERGRAQTGVGTPPSRAER